MSDPWWRAGGAVWLDAVLYDTRQREPDVLLARGGDETADDGDGDAESG